MPSNRVGLRRWILGLALAVAIVLLALNLWRLNSPPAPDPRLINVSVRSTLFALPTQTPYMQVATVVVTRVVSVTVVATATPTATSAAGAPTTPVAADLPASLITTDILPVEQAIALSASTEEIASSVAVAPAAEQSAAPAHSCPVTSDRTYDLIPVDGPAAEHPDAIHGDLNLGVRGWSPVDAELAVVDINGPSDSDPPQLATIFGDGRLPAFTSAFQIYDWDWGCSANGCRGDLMTHHDVMLLGMATNPGEALSIPNRGAQVYGGGYKALVLYAEANRITLGYTREDSVANGYTVHLENLCVDPALVAVYQQGNYEGRGRLPALRDDEVMATAGLGEVRVAVRDRGVFLDPWARKDWWRGF